MAEIQLNTNLSSELSKILDSDEIQPVPMSAMSCANYSGSSTRWAASW